MFRVRGCRVAFDFVKVRVAFKFRQPPSAVKVEAPRLTDKVLTHVQVAMRRSDAPSDFEGVKSNMELNRFLERIKEFEGEVRKRQARKEAEKMEQELEKGDVLDESVVIAEGTKRSCYKQAIDANQNEALDAWLDKYFAP